MDTPERPWSRTLALLSAIVATVCYLWVNPFGFLPGPVAAGLGSVPVTLLLYGLSGQPWTTCLAIGVSTGLGIGFGTYLG